MPSSSLLGLERGYSGTPWVGVLLSLHPDTARKGKVDMIYLSKEEKQSEQNKPSLEVGREHRRVCCLSIWSLRADCWNLNPSSATGKLRTLQGDYFTSMHPNVLNSRMGIIITSLIV